MSRRKLRTAVVTGPTGAIGMALCKVLLEDGATVYAVTHSGSRRVEALHSLPHSDNLHIIFCDAAEYARLPELLCNADTGIDAFYHLAWTQTFGQGRDDVSAQIINLQYTIDALRAAAALHSNIFIGAGSQAEFGHMDPGPTGPDAPTNPYTAYGICKLAAGQLAMIEGEKLGLPVVWPRIFSVYGPNDKQGTLIDSLVRKMSNGEHISTTQGIQDWDYLYCDDAAEAFLRIGECCRESMVYCLGSGEVHPLRYYIDEVKDVLDYDQEIGYGEVPYTDKSVMHLQADITQLIEDTGWRPQTLFRDGIRKIGGVQALADQSAHYTAT